MLTPEERAEVARENGAKSHGPATPEGKARSAASNTRRAQRAAIIRMLTPAHSAVFCSEDRTEFYRLVDRNISKYRPIDETELALVTEITDYCWRLARVAIIESGIWNRELLRQYPKTVAFCRETHAIENLVSTADALAANSRTLKFLAAERRDCKRLIVTTERQLVYHRQHFPGDSAQLADSRVDRALHCFPHPATTEQAQEAAAEPTETVENTQEVSEKQNELQDTYFKIFTTPQFSPIGPGPVNYDFSDFEPGYTAKLQDYDPDPQEPAEPEPIAA